MPDRKTDAFEFRAEEAIIFPELNVSANFEDYRDEAFARAYHLAPGFYVVISPVTEENLLDKGFVFGLIKNIRAEINERLQKEAEEGGRRGSMFLQSELYDVDLERGEVTFQVSEAKPEKEDGEIIH